MLPSTPVPIAIRRAHAGDRPALRLLFEAAFGGTLDLAEWAWKYDANPFAAASVIASDGERALGFFGGLGTRYRGDEGALPGVAGVDVMTARDARRLGTGGNLYREMGEAFVLENRALGIPFYFGFPNERHRSIGERLLGFRTVERAGEWTRPLAGLAPRGRLRRRLLRAERVTGFGPRHDALAEEIHARPGWRTERTRAALHWRYAARPGIPYHLLELRGPFGRSEGYLVARPVGGRALLVDLQLRDERSGPLGDLVGAAAEAMAPLGATVLEIRLAGCSPIGQRLVGEMGFVPKEADTCLEMIPVDPAFPIDGALGRFDYRFGDHEIF